MFRVARLVGVIFKNWCVLSSARWVLRIFSDEFLKGFVAVLVPSYFKFYCDAFFACFLGRDIAWVGDASCDNIDCMRSHKWSCVARIGQNISSEFLICTKDGNSFFSVISCRKYWGSWYPLSDNVTWDNYWIRQWWKLMTLTPAKKIN